VTTARGRLPRVFIHAVTRTKARTVRRETSRSSSPLASSRCAQMNDKRQNQHEERQLQLPFAAGERGEAPVGPEARVESSASPHKDQSPTRSPSVMQEVLQPENLKTALKQVQANKGAPGIDGLTVGQLPDFLATHWPRIRQQLLAGTYRPSAVRRVDIPKPDGGVRKLGIPTVLDRFIQQAVGQVLTG
jgi:RNA-directed DNA polymerase